MRRSDDSLYTLAANASATGAAVSIRGGAYAFMADGTVGGATVSLQTQLPDGSWSDVSMFGGTIKTTALPYSVTGIQLPAGSVRAAITGGAGVSLNASLVGIG
jgi:hypothetical protein